MELGIYIFNILKTDVLIKGKIYIFCVEAYTK